MNFDDYEQLPTPSVTTNMIAGAAAGVLEHCVMYPMDSIKVNFKRVVCIQFITRLSFHVISSSVALRDHEWIVNSSISSMLLCKYSLFVNLNERAKAKNARKSSAVTTYWANLTSIRLKNISYRVKNCAWDLKELWYHIISWIGTNKT